MCNLIIFPSSYFNINKVDEDLEKEYEAVTSTGLFDVVTFGYNKWFNEEKLILTKYHEEMHSAVYRGWMMKPEQYKKFYDELLKKNIKLITDPNQYELMHCFPNIYDKIKEDTAKIMTFNFSEKIDMEKIKTEFNLFMVKDFVKSVKGTEFPVYFDSSITQEEFDNYMKIFYKYRGDLLTGGICVKEFLDLKKYGPVTNEYRTFYTGGKVLSICKNSNQPEDALCPSEELIDKYKDLGSSFYTIDFAELSDGSWKILETGDGGVSGIPDGMDYEIFFRKLYELFKR